MLKLRVAVVSLALPTLGLASTAKFLDYRDYLLAGTPQALAIADVNRDGIADLVVGTAGGIQVLLGRGDGTFRPPLTVGNTSVLALVVGDFNNDGVPDIAATLLSKGTHIVLALGNGDGTFQSPELLPIPCIDCYLAAADFNGDGKMDLAVASTSLLAVFPGNGDGTFGKSWPAYATRFTTAVRVGDANRDGKPDLVVTDFAAGSIVVLLGNGNGTFQRTNYPVDNSLFQSVLADFNGDGLPDLATVDRDSGVVWVLLNQGAGVFGPPTSFPAGCASFQGCTLQGLAAGDFTHRGKLDLATPGAILYGNGDGTFQPPARFSSGAFPWQVASEDFNGDGYDDLLVANSAATNISVLLSDAQSLLQPLRVTAGDQPKAAATADFNGDGRPDLAVAAEADNQVNILLGAGNGGFLRGASLSVEQPGAVIAQDLNGDRIADLAISSDFGTWIYLGNGDGTFQAGAHYPAFYGDCTFHAVRTTAAPCFASADFNGDGIPDLVGANWTDGVVAFLLGNGDGTFASGPQTLKVADVPSGIAVGDFNRDGRIDVAVSGYFGSISVFPGNGDGTFGAPVVLSIGGTGAGLAVGDVNGDGIPDIVAAGGSGGSGISSVVFVLTGNGDLTFNAPVALLADQAPNGIVLADFNGDGRLDIASANFSGDDIAVFLNEGNMQFSRGVLYGAGSSPVVLCAVDLNGDGKQDIVVVNQNSSDLSVVLHAAH